MAWNGEIDWTVQGVFDPDGTGGDFSYTVGLHAAHGVPELHMWARPTDGVDPGADWILSLQDQCRVLNEVAAAVLRGERAVGDTWSAEYDSGFTTVHFTLAGPVDRDEVEAFANPPGTPVLEVRWSLERPVAPADPTPISAQWSTTAAGLLERIRAAAADREALWGTAGVGAGPSGAGDDDPASALSREVSGLVETTAELLDPLLSAITTASRSRWALGTCVAAGRASGRSDAVAAALVVAEAHAATLCGRIGEDDPEFLRAAELHVRHHLCAAYAALVVADVIPDAALHAGAGWVLALLDPQGAQAAFDTWCDRQRPGKGGGDAPTSDQLAWAVWALGAQAAADGRGAPLWDDDAESFAKLDAAGYRND